MCSQVDTLFAATLQKLPRELSVALVRAGRDDACIPCQLSTRRAQRSSEEGNWRGPSGRDWWIWYCIYFSTTPDIDVAPGGGTAGIALSLSQSDIRSVTRTSGQIQESRTGSVVPSKHANRKRMKMGPREAESGGVGKLARLKNQVGVQTLDDHPTRNWLATKFPVQSQLRDTVKPEERADKSEVNQAQSSTVLAPGEVVTPSSSSCIISSAAPCSFAGHQCWMMQCHLDMKGSSQRWNQQYKGQQRQH